MANSRERGLPVEQLREFIKTTPEAKLKWLADAQEFVRNVVPPEKLERWRKLQNKKDSF